MPRVGVLGSPPLGASQLVAAMGKRPKAKGKRKAKYRRDAQAFARIGEKYRQSDAEIDANHRRLQALWAADEKRVKKPAMNLFVPAADQFELFKSDAVALLELLDSDSVDLVITDPPYESLEKHRKVGTTTRLKHSKGSSNDWFDIFANERFPALFAQVYRVLKRNRHFYLFCDAETMFVAKPLAEAAGFKFWKPLVWDKVAIGMGYHYRARYEFILFFEKGKRNLVNKGTPDILTQKRIWEGYPTEKPVEISTTLVTQSSQPGELVVDPFCGSGSVGEAAINEWRRFIGGDTCHEALSATSERLTQALAVRGDGVRASREDPSRGRAGLGANTQQGD